MGTIDLISFWTIFVKHSYVSPVLSDNVQQINPTNCLCNYFVRQKTPPQHDNLKKLSSPIPLSRKPYMRSLSLHFLWKKKNPLLIIYSPENEEKMAGRTRIQWRSPTFVVLRTLQVLLSIAILAIVVPKPGPSYGYPLQKRSLLFEPKRGGGSHSSSSSGGRGDDGDSGQTYARYVTPFLGMAAVSSSSQKK
jgi:hypothetical protein